MIKSMTEKEVKEELNSIFDEATIEFNDRDVYVYVPKINGNQVNQLAQFHNKRLITMEVLPSEEGSILINMTVY